MGLSLMLRGNPYSVISAIDTSGGIASSRTSGDVPCFVQVSASAITATGTSKPFEDLEFFWDFGEGAEYFINPRNGIRTNARYQYGPEAAYVYRTAGSKTITLRCRGLDSNGDYVTETKTLGITVSAFSGTEYWFDSVDGDDGNNGTSPSTPKQTMSALIALLGNDTKFNLKRGSTWTDQLAITAAAYDGLRFAAYGSGANPKIRTTSENALSMTNGGSSSPRAKNDIVFSDIDTIRTDSAAAIYISSGGNSTAEMSHIYFDKCNSEGESSSGGIVVQMETGAPNAVGFGVWGGSIANPAIADQGARFGCYGGAKSWFFVVGAPISGGGSNTTLDHHIYPTTRYHSLYKWIEFGDGPGRNFCINTNYNQVGETLEYADYHLISECKLSGTLRAWDAGNGDGDPSLSRFRNFVVDRCDLSGLTGDALFIAPCAETMTIREPRVWDCNGGRWFAPPSPLDDICELTLTGLEGYRASGSGALVEFVGTWTTAQIIKGNTFVDLRSTAEIIKLVTSDHVSAGSDIDENIYYMPNDMTVFNDNATLKTFTQWQSSGMDANGENSDPGFIDGANGVFNVAAGKVEFSLSLSG